MKRTSFTILMTNYSLRDSSHRYTLFFSCNGNRSILQFAEVLRARKHHSQFQHSVGRFHRLVDPLPILCNPFFYSRVFHLSKQIYPRLSCPRVQSTPRYFSYPSGLEGTCSTGNCFLPLPRSLPSDFLCFCMSFQRRPKTSCG